MYRENATTSLVPASDLSVGMRRRNDASPGSSPTYLLVRESAAEAQDPALAASHVKVPFAMMG
jgi:hypothetical protein